MKITSHIKHFLKISSMARSVIWLCILIILLIYSFIALTHYPVQTDPFSAHIIAICFFTPAIVFQVMLIRYKVMEEPLEILTNALSLIASGMGIVLTLGAILS